MKKVMDGQTFKETVIAGLGGLKSNIDTVNDLNVFPIPDGDTGENMGATLFGGVNAIAGDESLSVGEVASAFSRGAVMGARGNSGVILSQFFAGLADGIGEKEEIDAAGMGEAMREGVRRAYEAVATPVEGTMLTVLREATEAAVSSNAETLEEFFGNFALAAKEWTDKTPEMLDVLREAGVVDSGGMGVYYLAVGMEKALRGEKVEGAGEMAEQKKELDFDLFTENDEMKFGYCTEFMLRLTKKKTDVDSFDVSDLRSWLEDNGDSVVIFKTGTIVKVHVHTFEPEKILAHCHAYGEFLTLKIENMTLQHNGKTEKKQTFRHRQSRSEFAIVTVACGKGMKNLFGELGADAVIDGGQGNNPSTEVFIEAFDAVNADNIFVLPNNGNVVMAAEQAAKEYEKSRVRVIPTKTMGDGYAALSMLDYDSGEAATIEKEMTDNMQSMTTALVSKSVRDANICGVEIKKDEYIGFVGKKMLVSAPDKISAALGLLARAGGKQSEFITVFYGEDATDEDKVKLKQAVPKIFPNAEFYETDGGQEVYDFMFVIE